MTGFGRCIKTVLLLMPWLLLVLSLHLLLLPVLPLPTNGAAASIAAAILLLQQLLLLLLL
jgi:hypothetical protein